MKLWLLLVCLCGTIAEKRFVLDGDTQYRISVFTGDKVSSGTHSHAFLSITGVGGVTKELRLDGGSDGFGRGGVDQFDLKAAAVGNITSIHVRRDNHGALPGWYLDKITIEDGHAIYEFPCSCWFDHLHHGGALIHTLKVGSYRALQS